MADTTNAPGTVFPGFDGTPGDQIPAEDISGQPLEPLMSPDDPLAAGTGSSLPSAPGGGAGADAGDARSQTIAGGEVPAPAQRKARTANDRIAQLTKRYRDEQRARGDIEGRLEEAIGILRAQGEELTRLRSGRAPSKANEAADALGLAGVPDGQGSPGFTLESLSGVIERKFEEFEARRSQRDNEIRQLQASQEMAFKEATEEMPELLDPRSPARQYFDELYRTSPLKTLPDGPYQIALQVRGLLADEVRHTPAPERKVQAGVIVPSGGPVDTNSRAALEKEYAELTALRKKGNDEFPVYKRWRTVREQLLRQPRR